MCALMRGGFETDERELNHLRKNQKSDRVLPFTNLFSDIHAVISSLGFLFFVASQRADGTLFPYH